MVAFTTNKTVAIVALPDARNRPRPILPLTASLPPCEKKPLWTRAPTEGHGGRRDACEVRPGRRRRAAIHRSEERRVGKECRAAWLPEHVEKSGTQRVTGETSSKARR